MIAACRLLAWRPCRTNAWQPKACQAFFPYALLIAALCLPAFTARAAPQIEALQGLDFGILAVTSNATPSTVKVSPRGSTSYGTGFIFIAAAQPGRYRLSGYPPFTDIGLSMSAAQLNVNGTGPSETLTVSAAVTAPQTLRTDQNGTVEFDLGATLTTSGTGAPYEDGPYPGVATLNLSFEVAGAPVLSDQEIEIDLTLRTSLALAEVAPLDFGKLSVSASAIDQASLRLDPNGQVAISSAGAARILRYGGELSATFRVSAGAAFAPIRVNLPTETVYLVHQSQSPEVARLLVTDFNSQPSAGNLKLNTLGDLEFRVGATLRTEQTTKQYQDGEYSGTYSLTVEY